MIMCGGGVWTETGLICMICRIRAAQDLQEGVLLRERGHPFQGCARAQPSGEEESRATKEVSTLGPCDRAKIPEQPYGNCLR